MNKNVSSKNWMVAGVFVFSIAFPLGQSSSRAQQVVPEAQLSVTDWDDTALKAKISFEAKRKALKDVLTDVQRQSGVKIETGKAIVASASLVTARVKDMTVGALMQALTRVYGVAWSKNGNGGYAMQDGDPASLAFKEARKDGLSRRYKILNDYKAELDRDANTAQEVFNSVDPQLWKEPQGVPFVALPEDVQLMLRQRIEQSMADGIITQAKSEREVFNEKLQLRLGVISSNTKSFYPERMGNLQAGGFFNFDRGAELGIYTIDGRFVTNIFPNFRGPRQTELAASNEDVTDNAEPAIPEDR